MKKFPLLTTLLFLILMVLLAVILGPPLAVYGILWAYILYYNWVELSQSLKIIIGIVTVGFFIGAVYYTIMK